MPRDTDNIKPGTGGQPYEEELVVTARRLNPFTELYGPFLSDEDMLRTYWEMRARRPHPGHDVEDDAPEQGEGDIWRPEIGDDEETDEIHLIEGLTGTLDQAELKIEGGSEYVTYEVPEMRFIYRFSNRRLSYRHVPFGDPFPHGTYQTPSMRRYYRNLHRVQWEDIWHAYRLPNPPPEPWPQPPMGPEAMFMPPGIPLEERIGRHVPIGTEGMTDAQRTEWINQQHARLRGPTTAGARAGSPSTLLFMWLLGAVVDYVVDMIDTDDDPSKWRDDLARKNGFLMGRIQGLIVNEIEDGAWVHTDSNSYWRPEPMLQPQPMPDHRATVVVTMDYYNQLQFEFNQLQQWETIQRTHQDKPPGALWRTKAESGLAEPQLTRIVLDPGAEDVANEVMHRMINGLMNRFGDAYDLLPNVDLDVKVQPKLSGQKSLSVRVRVDTKDRNRRYKELKYRQGEQKKAHTWYYIALLSFVNRTWGTISEIQDFFDALDKSLVDDQGRPLRADLDFWEKIDLYMRGKATLDMDLFLINLLYEQMIDATIGTLKRAETRALLKGFGPAHPINNMLGSVSTWARRLGDDPFYVPTQAIKAMRDAALKAAGD